MVYKMSKEIKKRNRKPSMPLEKEDAMIKDYLDDQLSVDEIVKKHGTGSGTFYKALKRRGVSKKGEAGKGLGRVHSDETKAKMSESHKKLSS